MSNTFFKFNCPEKKLELQFTLNQTFIYLWNDLRIHVGYPKYLERYQHFKQ